MSTAQKVIGQMHDTFVKAGDGISGFACVMDKVCCEVTIYVGIEDEFAGILGHGLAPIKGAPPATEQQVVDLLVNLQQHVNLANKIQMTLMEMSNRLCKHYKLPKGISQDIQLELHDHLETHVKTTPSGEPWAGHGGCGPHKKFQAT